MEFWNKFVLVFLCICIISGVIFLPLHYLNNKVDYANKKIDEATLYDTLKQVEDTCRAMIASYQSDFLIWAQYKDSTNEEKQGWAEMAKMRANRTATTYNEYIRKNSYVWAQNVPADIDEKLDYIQ